jgi:hypothetical protein
MNFDPRIEAILEQVGNYIALHPVSSATPLLSDLAMHIVAAHINIGLYKRTREEQRHAFEAQPPSPDNIAIDVDGKTLPLTPMEISKVTNAALHDGKLQLVVLEDKHGQLIVQAMGGPSEEMVNILKATLRGYKRALAGRN